MRRQALAVLCVCVALSAAAGMGPRARAADIETLQERAKKIAESVTALERRRADLDARRAALEEQVSETTQSIVLLETRLGDADVAAQKAQELYEERAVEAYMSGGTASELELFLSAQDMSQIVALAEMRGAAAAADDDALDTLIAARSEMEREQEELEDAKASLLDAQRETLTIEAGLRTALDEHRARMGELRDQIEELEAAARRAAREAAAKAAEEAANAAPSQTLLDLLSPAGPSNDIPEGFVSTGVAFEGLASWYGPGFEGNLTASGDVFDSSLMTAASKTLPLGTWLHVSYNGRGVVVLINDRGPYVEPRILDLSRGAAQAIGMESAGVGWVKAEILIKA